MGNKREKKTSTIGGILIINIRNINSELTKPHSKSPCKQNYELNINF